MIASIVDCEKNSRPWFGIHTKPRAEKVAAIQLEVRGYHVFLPVYQKHNKWSDRVVQVDCALFPGYLFCRFDSRLPPIVSVPSVVSIIGHGGQPEPIPEHEIAAIQTMLQSGFLVEPCLYLREGERVIIVKGALRGVEGFLIKNKNKFRVVVSVSLLRRSVAVELDSEAVRAGFMAERFSSTTPVRIAAPSPLQKGVEPACAASARTGTAGSF